jgi:tryptophan synthase alpha chain
MNLTTTDALAARFRSWREAGRRALIPYVTAGYPGRDETAELLDALVDAGADIIEVGVPFSDPVADGPTIQRSSQRALENGTTLEWTIGQVSRFRSRHETPIVLFTYLNPILRYGVDRFLSHAVSAGADGVLVLDLPVGVDSHLERAIEESRLALVHLVAPTTPPARAERIARQAQGFLYYVSRTGVTGARTELREGLGREVEALRQVSSVPVAVGFGISTGAQAAEVATVADGVVVGSALIDAIERGGIGVAADLLTSMRRAIDSL